MCGICGYIGDSKYPDVTFDLISRLFERTEIRGEDASGIWGSVDDQTVIYHKEPVKSSVFVKRTMWQKVGELNPNLLICHARAASAGVGVPTINRNNHPFLSQNGRIGLIHNGRIPDVEYRALKKHFTTVSSCDSEILLRIFEASDHATEARIQEFGSFEPNVAARLAGLKDIWSFLSLGHMAVAIGENENNGVRRLWLFRNKHRSLWLADMRNSLGQVFFFSVPQIWKDAIDSPKLKSFLSGSVKLIDLPTEEIWMFKTSPDLPLTKRDSLKRFEVCSSGSYTALQEDQIAVPAATRIEKVELVTGLEDDDKLAVTADEDDATDAEYSFVGTTPRSGVNNALTPINAADQNSTQTQIETQSMPYQLSPEDINPEDVDALCDSVAGLAEKIKTVFASRATQSSVSPNDFQDVKTQLEQIELDLAGTLRIIER